MVSPPMKNVCLRPCLIPEHWSKTYRCMKENSLINSWQDLGMIFEIFETLSSLSVRHLCLQTCLMADHWSNVLMRTLVNALICWSIACSTSVWYLRFHVRNLKQSMRISKVAVVSNRFCFLLVKVSSLATEILLLLLNEINRVKGKPCHQHLWYWKNLIARCLKGNFFADLLTGTTT